MQTLLFLHLVGAFVTGVLVLWSIVLVLRPTSERTRSAARAIAVGAAYQLVTGSLLAVADPVENGSFLRFCARIGLYVAIIVAAEGMLFWRMRAARLPFPSRLVAASASISTVFVIGTLVRLL